MLIPGFKNHSMVIYNDLIGGNIHGSFLFLQFLSLQLMNSEIKYNSSFPHTKKSKGEIQILSDRQELRKLVSRKSTQLKEFL